MIEILLMVKRDGLTHQEVASLYGTNRSLVTRLLRNEKLKKMSIAQIRAKKNTAKALRKKVGSCVQRLLDEDKHIWTVAQV